MNKKCFGVVTWLWLYVILILGNSSLIAGQITGWGSNGYHCLDVPAGDDFIAVEAANYHSLALRSDGSLISWGDYAYEVPVGNNYIAIAAGDCSDAFAIALKSDGTLEILGTWPDVQNVPTGNDFVQISAGSYHCLALRQDGSIAAWGNDAGGCVSLTPFRNDIVAVEAGQNYSLALTSSGTIIGWGTGSSANVVQDIPSGNFIAISAGSFFALGLKADGSVVGFGHNGSGQCDVPSGNDYIAIEAGSWHGIAQRVDGSIVAWGEPAYSLPVPEEPNMLSFGSSAFHNLALVGQIEMPEKYSGGIGAAENPYQISTVSDWQELMATTNDWDKHFVLTANIDLAGIILNPVGNESTKFTGTLDGNRHIIRNANINEPDGYGVGIFGYLGLEGQIRKLGVMDINISGSSCVGGLVGYNDSGSIVFCYTTGFVVGEYSIGGLVGWNHGPGLVTASFSMCDVSCIGPYQAGGLVGVHAGTINSCYATGAVSGSNYIGGLVSENYCTGGSCGTIINSYATGEITGTNSRVGGVIGNGYVNNQNGYNCYWDIQTSGISSGVGEGITDGIIGKSTLEMQTLSTFISAGWDFVGETGNGTNDYWVMPQGGGYPEIAYWYVEPVSLSVLSPNGGESLVAGEEYLIEWSIIGDVNEVLIEYSIDNGVNWIEVESLNTGNTGAYNWLVHVADSNECLVRISDAEDPAIFDVSDSTFSITTPIIEPTVNFDPNTLNVSGNGKWITATLYFPADSDVSEINPQTILLNDVIAPDWYWFDVITNQIKVKFNRDAVIALVPLGDVTLTISGEFEGGIQFEGFSTIRVIDGSETEEPPVSYTCTTYPLMDFNEDCIVNMADYVIFMTHWLECTREPVEACGVN